MPQAGLISVVIPAYNAADFLEETMRSVLSQTYRPLQLVVVNDKSTDGTAALALSLTPAAEKAGVDLVVIDQEVNGGAALALRTGFAHAAGHYICWLSADDVYIDPSKLAKQAAAMAKSGAALSYFRDYVAGPDPAHAHGIRSPWMPGKPYADSWVLADPRRTYCAQLFGGAMNGSSVMIERAHYERSRGFDPIVRNIDPDGDMWLRMAGAGMPFVCVPGAPLFYRLHAGQTSCATGPMILGSMMTRVRSLDALAEAGRLADTLSAGWPILAERIIGRRFAVRAGRAYSPEVAVLWSRIAEHTEALHAELPAGMRLVGAEARRLADLLLAGRPDQVEAMDSVLDMVAKAKASEVYSAYVNMLRET